MAKPNLSTEYLWVPQGNYHLVLSHPHFGSAIQAELAEYDGQSVHPYVTWQEMKSDWWEVANEGGSLLVGARSA